MRQRSTQRGAALVITLSLVVLVTILAVAFLARTQLNQMVESGATGREKAEIVALAGLEALTADLLAEVLAATPPNNAPPFRPAAETAFAPARVVSPSLSTSVPTLVKQSIAAGPIVPIGAPYDLAGITRQFPAASSVSTATPASDGRFISPNRWNSIRLLEMPLAGADQLPNWIYMNRGGFPSAQTISANWSNTSAANANAIVGRVAFNVYDVSGLLNANAAGYPPSLPGAVLAEIKGTLAGADLAQLPNTAAASVGSLVAFRNPAAADYGAFVADVAVPSGFANHVMRSPNGGEVTNSFFVSRQDLIRYATRQNPGIEAALPFLVHSRPSKNAPATRPPYNAREKTGGSSVADFQYRDREGNSAALNRDVLSVRLLQNGTLTGHRIDGTGFTYAVRAGEPLVQRRFPLQKLAWLGPSGPVAVSPAAVQHSFGLRWDNGKNCWEYVGPSGSAPRTQIATLHEVAQEMREPNFFELLQAGILDGSLGVSYGNAQLGDPAWQNNTTLQILRIGACIIDQYDADSFPTVIEFSSPGGAPFWRAVGVEDLPYIEMVQTIVGNKPGADALVPYVGVRLFNPHRAGPVTSAAPSVRIAFQGHMRFRCWWGDRSAGTGIQQSSNTMGSPGRRLGEMIVETGTPVVSPAFDPSTFAGNFRSARWLQTGDFQGAIPDTLSGNPSDPTWSTLPAAADGSRVGLRMPDFAIDPNYQAPQPFPNTDAVFRSFHVYYGFRSGAGPASHANFQLEFQTPGGIWIPYSFWTGINEEVTWASTTNYNVAVVGQGATPETIAYTGVEFSPGRFATAVTAIRSDPRSFRINGFFMNAMPGMDLSPSPSVWSPAAPGNSGGSGYGGTDTQVAAAEREPGTPGAPAAQRTPLRKSYQPETGNWAGSTYPGWLSRNFRSVASERISAYEDADGVRRLADSGRYGNEKPGNATPTAGNPYEREADRPVMLNRPFRNVGELGYVFRDLPWRTLDFSSQNSADAALLDLFTLTDADVPVVENRIALHRAPEPVLRALLAGTAMDVSPAAPVLSATQAQILAQALRINEAALTSTGNLALAVLGPLTGDYTNPNANTLLADSVFGGEDNAKIKARREAVARVLGSISDDRTWVLTIDLIAQAGRFAPGATDAARFIVQGERRYWLHLSLDRFTGEIVARSLEPVQE